METRTGNRIVKRMEQLKAPSRRLTATAIRRLPKAERDRIMNEQFRKAKGFYAKHPELVV